MSTGGKQRDARAIAHHYDVSNDFYELFLDPLMVYTCAYYRDPDGKLERAQEDKLDLVCRKLRLQAGESVLDIGCGWGGFSIWAAQHYGVRAHGVTLSRAQADWAAARIAREGLQDRCRVEFRDFRDLPADARYDKIAAIGVIEHVGVANYPAFFGRVHSMLNDGGLYLNHGIHHEFHWRRTTQTDFLYRNVFPNGDLSGVTETLTEMERARWEIVDVENLRLHYARTCRQWAERLQARAEEARAIVGERIYRTWLLYLTCSSVAFVAGLHRALPVPGAQAVGHELHAPDDARGPLRLREPGRRGARRVLRSRRAQAAADRQDHRADRRRAHHRVRRLHDPHHQARERPSRRAEQGVGAPAHRHRGGEHRDGHAPGAARHHARASSRTSRPRRP